MGLGARCPGPQTHTGLQFPQEVHVGSGELGGGGHPQCVTEDVSHDISSASLPAPLRWGWGTVGQVGRGPGQEALRQLLLSLQSVAGLAS